MAKEKKAADTSFAFGANVRRKAAGKGTKTGGKGGRRGSAGAENAWQRYVGKGR